MILTHGANSLSQGGGGDTVVIGGRRYPVVKIGNQLWMAENLDYKFEVNGSQIPIGQSGSPTTPAAWYYNNDESAYGIDGTYKCGLLYNWYAAKYLDDNKATLLPNGWHVPSSIDVTSLASECGGADVAGTKLKSLDNSITSNWPSSWNGTNDYGFNAIPSGWRHYQRVFYDFGSEADFWLITEYSDTYGHEFYFNTGESIILIASLGSEKRCGFSIRLVKDAT